MRSGPNESQPLRKVQKISGQKSRNNFVGFLEEVLTPKGHLEIN
jgi:hypothetical protein